MDEYQNDYIKMVKERLGAFLEIGLTADDYIHEKSIYGDIHSENTRKFYKQVLKEVPEIPKEKMISTLMEQKNVWDDLLTTQINYFSMFTENLFKVPQNILFESKVEMHEAIKNYDPKEDYKLDKKIEEVNKRIEKKQAYVNLLTIQAKELEIQKNALIKMV